MAGQGGSPVSGTAVAAATAGGVLLYAALTGQSVVSAIRDITSGKVKAIVPGTVTVLGTPANIPGGGPASATLGSSLGGNILQDAQKYLGVPYRWGGADPSGFDCSGLVTWVLHHDLGLNLPSNVHTVTSMFLVWSGAVTVASPQPGDLCCWGGHIGIYAGNGKMINAPHTGAVVQYSTVWGGVTYRRVKG